MHLVRLCDGGHLLPRGTITLALHGITPDAREVPGLGALLTRKVTFDLFEPPQRERIREESVRLTALKHKQRDIAQQLPEKATQAAVQKALVLDRTMNSLGLSTPYVLVQEPSEDYRKLRRHKNAKYRFEPLDGYQRPEL